MPTLRPQLQSLRDEADSVCGRAMRLKSLSPHQLRWSPSPDRWEILRILDHLNKTHSLCLPKFEEAARQAPTATKEEDKAPVPFGFGDRLFVKATSGELPFKVPVPPIFEPDKNSPDEAVQRFFDLHERLVAVIVHADERCLTGLRVPSSVNEKFRPGFLAYLTGMVLHEKYHWGQVEALLADSRFPAPVVSE